MTGVCTDRWEAYGACGWSIALLWRWRDWFVRGDVILLGLMLVSVIGIAIHVSYRLSRSSRDSTDGRGRRQLAADLGVEVAVVRSIVVAAPYLGLVGACFGILRAFGGIAMERSMALRLISLRVAVSVVTTVMGILVAIAATCRSHLSMASDGFAAKRERCRRLSRRPTFSPRSKISVTKEIFGPAGIRVDRSAGAGMSGRGL
jgi:MotA/TolQ/ExbB proton channel family